MYTRVEVSFNRYKRKPEKINYSTTITVYRKCCRSLSTSSRKQKKEENNSYNLKTSSPSLVMMMIRQEEQKPQNKKRVTFHKDVKAAEDTYKKGRSKLHRRKRTECKMTDLDPIIMAKAGRFLQFLADTPSSEILRTRRIEMSLQSFVSSTATDDETNEESLYEALVRLSGSKEQWQRGAPAFFILGAMTQAIQLSLYSDDDVHVAENNSKESSISSELTTLSLGNVEKDQGEDVAALSDSSLPSRGSHTTSQTSGDSLELPFSEADIENGRYVVDCVFGPDGRSMIGENLKNMTELEHGDQADPNDYNGHGDYTNNIWRFMEYLRDRVSDDTGVDRGRATVFLDFLSNALLDEPDHARLFLRWVSSEDTDATVASSTRGNLSTQGNTTW